MYLIFLAASLLFLLEFLLRSLEKKKRIRRMLGVEEQGLTERIVKYLKGNTWSARMVEKMAFSLAFLEWRFERASEVQLVLLILSLLAFSVLVFLVLVVLGYGLLRALLFLVVALALSLLLLYMLYRYGRDRFEASLPQIYRLLSSRYLVCGDMLEAIRGLIPELGTGAARLFENILSALQYNDLERRDERFLLMMKTIELEYFTLLLYIIKQSCEKGGREAILAQFVDLTEECLVEMQTKKDLRLLSRAYQILFLVMGALYLMTPALNRSLMLSGSEAYYASLGHSLISSFFMLILLGACWLLQYLERTF